MTMKLNRRTLVTGALAAASAATVPLLAQAQDTSRIRFALDWRFETPAAPFVLADQRGYFKAEKLDVQIDVGTGSASAVQRVASGAYDMGFADMSALMEFVGNNPDAPQKPVAVMMAYANTASAIIALKSSGIKAPKDLEGRKLGGPLQDASRRAFPVFASATHIDMSKIQWTTMAPPLREQMLAKGDVDAIAGFTYFSPFNVLNYGVKSSDLVVMPYTENGARLYGHAIIASQKFLTEHPEAVRGFLRAVTKGTRDAIQDPVAGTKAVKIREPLINETLGVDMLRGVISACIATPDARAETFGNVSPPRLALMASQVADVLQTKTRIDSTKLFDGRFLPTAAERNILGK